MTCSTALNRETASANLLSEAKMEQVMAKHILQLAKIHTNHGFMSVKHDQKG